MTKPVTSFKAVVYSIRTDREGESKVTFEVPLSDMADVAKLLLVLQTIVTVTVEQETQG